MSRAFVCTMFIVVIAVSSVSATTIHVPADTATIQGGIDMAVNGDTVLVAPGTYLENIDFLSKAIVVVSEAGAESTIIEKQSNSLPIVTLSNIEISVAYIQGFTITGSTGGGIQSSYSNSVIKDNIISNNYKNGHGGGIYLDHSSSLISNNTIDNNSSGNAGGGISMWDSHDCEITNNTIVKNESDDGGGGIYSTRTPYLNIVNNTIDFNTCHNITGSGIFLEYMDDALLKNNIVSNNYPLYGISAISSTSISIIYCDFFNNEPSGYNQVSPSEGCIDCNPLFCNPNVNNYYLSEGSCCLGAGEGGADIGAFGVGCTYNPGVISGVVRESDSTILIENVHVSLLSTTIDDFTNTYGEYLLDSIYAGIYDISFSHPDYREIVVTGIPVNPGDTTNLNIIMTYPIVLHVATTGNDTTGDGSEINPYATIQHGIDMSLYGDTVLVASGTYQENIDFLSKAIVVMSEAGAESTIIEKQTDYLPIVNLSNIEIGVAHIQGFTITGSTGGGIQSCWWSNSVIQNNIISNNSTPGYGGGIYIRSSSSLISNNIIVNNSSGLTGGGISMRYSYDCEITNNTIVKNESVEEGGGIYARRTPYLNIVNNTIDSNTCINQTGSGIFFSYNRYTLFQNNIVSNNYPFYGISSTDPLDISIFYCDFFNNEPSSYDQVSPGEGCIECNPLFCNPNVNNYYLSEGSCCLGAGEGGFDIGAFGIGCSGYPYLMGDVNMYLGLWPTFVVGSDVTYLVNYFKGTPSSQPCLISGVWRSADINGDCNVMGNDVIRLVNYFKGINGLSFCPMYPPLWASPYDCPDDPPEGWPPCE